MKKSVFAILFGVCLGILMMIGVISVLNMKPSNEEMMALNNKTTESKSQSEEVWFTEEQTEESELTDGLETEMSELEEVETEKSQKVTATKNEPENYPYYIRVNRQANCVTIYTKDAAGNYTVPVKAMTCSVGFGNDTPLGVFKISDKYTWRLLFGDTYGQYSVRFNGHILFHSVPYTEMLKDTLKEGQYNLLGEPASQGCIRLTVADAKWIYDNCRKGTQVEVYDSPDPGPLGKPATYQISANSPYRGWDPTDPDSANPWKTGKVSISGVKNITINQGDKVDLLSGVSATDVDGLSLSVKVSTVDVNVPGVYTITYSATGVLGTTATATATLTVNAVEPPETEEPDTPEVPEDTEIPEGTEDTENIESPEGTEVSQEIDEEGL